MSLCFPNHLASESYLTLNAQIDLWLSNRLVNVSHLNFPRRIFSYVFYPAKMSSLGFYFNSLICTNMAGRFGANNVPNACVTSTSYLRSHQEKTHTQVSILAGTQNVNKNVCHACGPFPPEKKGKNIKSARTHPAYWQSWDTLRIGWLLWSFFHFFLPFRRRRVVPDSRFSESRFLQGRLFDFSSQNLDWLAGQSQSRSGPRSRFFFMFRPDFLCLCSPMHSKE